jgi:uncharacterized protein YjbI with pentapeptide repeats
MDREIPHPFDGLNPAEFERFCQRLLRSLGYQNVVWRKGTPGDSSGPDGGYDLEAKLPRTDPDRHTWQERWFVECKQRHTRPLPFGETEALRALHEEADVLLIMLDGQLTLQTRQKLEDWSNKHPRTKLRIWERHDLEDLHGKALGHAPDGTGSPFNEFLAASGRTSHRDPSARQSAFAVLEQLGVANPELRQSVIDEVCHYLRSPATLGAEELKLRLYLQKLLRRRLTAWDENGERTEQPWEGIDLDLSGAELTDFTFAEGTVYGADFADTHFSGRTDFHGSDFQHSVNFASAIFSEYTSFTKCRFPMSTADFGGAHFRSACTFHRAIFSGAAIFTKTRFTEEASFLKTRFEGPVNFRRARLHEGATFESAVFEDDTYFYDTNFGPMGHFLNARFEGAVSFRGATQAENIDLHHALGNSSLALQTWPEGWCSAFRDCLALVREDEKREVISRHGLGPLCGHCRARNACRLRHEERD